MKKSSQRLLLILDFISYTGFVRILLVISIFTFLQRATAQVRLDFPEDFDQTQWSHKSRIRVIENPEYLQLQFRGISSPASIAFDPDGMLDMRGINIISIVCNSSEPLKLRLDLEDASGTRTGDVPIYREIIFPEIFEYKYEIRDRMFQYKPEYRALDQAKIDKLIFTVEPGPNGFTGNINLKAIEAIKIEVEGTSENIHTQEEFDQLVTDIFSQIQDKQKMKELVLQAIEYINDSPNLETYANYYMIATVYQTQFNDEETAQQFREKAEKLIYGGSTLNLVTQWNTYYTQLFQTNDIAIIDAAYNFLEAHDELQNLNNYSGIGYAYERVGEFEKAGEIYEKALLHDVDSVGNQFQNYYFVFYYFAKTGNFNKAEKFIEKLIQLSRKADPNYATSYYMGALSNQFYLYHIMGDYRKYLESYERYSRLYSNLYGTLDSCRAFNWTNSTVYANSHESLHEFDLAAYWWQFRDSSHIAYVNCFNEKYSQLSDFTQYPQLLYPVFLSKTGSLDMNRDSISEIIEINQRYFENLTYDDPYQKYSRGKILGFLGSEEYHTWFSEFLSTYGGNRDFNYGTLPFTEYAWFNTRDKNMKKALEVYTKLFDVSEEWINDLIFTFGESAFITFFNSKISEGYDNFHSYVRLVKEAGIEEYEQAVSMAYNNILLTKSIAFRGTQRRKKAFLMTSDRETVALYDEWIRKKRALVEVYQRQSIAETIPQKEQKADSVDIDRLRSEVNNLENQLAARSKEFQRLLKLESPDWRKLRNKLKKNEAAIEMVRFNWRDQVYYSDTTWYAAYILRWDSKFPEVVYLPSLADDLEGRFYRYYLNGIRYRQPDTLSYNHFWKPIGEKLDDIETIYFSPDGIYHLININTLKNPASGDYLQQEREIRFLTSTSDLDTNPPAKEGVNYSYLVGRPSYDLQEVPLTLIADSEGVTRSFIRDFRSGNISDLPGTEEEIRTIKDIMLEKGIRADINLLDNATEDKLYHLNNPDILHIATHGYWSSTPENSSAGYRIFQSMINSGLLLAGVVNYYRGESEDLLYDGILTAFEAQNIGLDSTRLVVLSACETGLGEVDAGEGVYGLQRAFRAAGARNVMTSLWKVDDEATRDFMIEFYRIYLDSGDVQEAYRTAIRKMQEKYPEPYYWGAFVLMGS